MDIHFGMKDKFLVSTESTGLYILYNILSPFIQRIIV